jgi:hypothetical protein
MDRKQERKNANQKEWNRGVKTERRHATKNKGSNKNK